MISSGKIKWNHPIYKEESEAKMTEKELEIMLDQAERKGIMQGIKIMQQKMLLACENGTPISINGRAYFVKSDMQNLQDIFADLEADAE